MGKSIDLLGAASLNIAIALLMTHELDAVMNKEWLVLPLTSWLSPTMGYNVFLWTHVPLFLVILISLSSLTEEVKKYIAITFSVLIVSHAGLHWAFSEHEHYEFSTISSNLLIYGGAIFGAIYLLITYFGKRKYPNSAENSK